jgi:hypothetical protein
VQLPLLLALQRSWLAPGRASRSRTRQASSPLAIAILMPFEDPCSGPDCRASDWQSRRSPSLRASSSPLLAREAPPLAISSARRAYRRALLRDGAFHFGPPLRRWLRNARAARRLGACSLGAGASALTSGGAAFGVQAFSLSCACGGGGACWSRLPLQCTVGPPWSTACTSPVAGARPSSLSRSCQERLTELDHPRPRPRLVQPGAYSLPRLGLAGLAGLGALPIDARCSRSHGGCLLRTSAR